MTLGAALGPGREFDLIREFIRRWGDAARAVGDDAALLDVPAGERLVISTDSAVEHVHFRRAWITPREIAFRAVAAALSDLAAMAATPLGVLVALTLPPSWRQNAPELADGIGDAVREAGTQVIGGDLSSGGELALAITVLGHAAAPLGRAGAHAGDAIYVTGRLGGPAAALAAWSRGEIPGAEARARFAHPVPRLREARWLAAHGARAAIDISDGLLGDAAHLAHAGGVRLAIELDRLNTCAGAAPLAAALSGEEYELLVSADAALDVQAFERTFGIPLAAVGRVQEGAPEVVATLHGERVAPSGGFDHFST